MLVAVSSADATLGLVDRTMLVKELLQNARKVATRHKLRSRIKSVGIWFVDVPRTSSTSIKVELGRQFGWPYGKENVVDSGKYPAGGLRDHLTALNVQEILGRKTWERLFTFSVVRNPWERMLSAYNYRIRKKHFSSELGFSSYLRLFKYAPEHELLDHKHLGSTMRSQVEFICDSLGNVLVDVVVRYEDRESGIDLVKSRFPGLEFGIARLQAGAEDTSTYRDAYDVESREIVAELFRDDIDFFGYDF